jgi:superfamily I DNA/RNA helicase
VSELRRRGVPLREIAVLYLYRVNFRSPLYEEALFEAGVPFQVREEAPAPVARFFDSPLSSPYDVAAASYG